MYRASYSIRIQEGGQFMFSITHPHSYYATKGGTVNDPNLPTALPSGPWMGMCCRMGGPVEVSPTRFLLGFSFIWARMTGAPGKSMALRRRFPGKQLEKRCYASGSKAGTPTGVVNECPILATICCVVPFTVSKRIQDPAIASLLLLIT